jgi:hypothetical protein
MHLLFPLFVMLSSCWRALFANADSSLIYEEDEQQPFILSANHHPDQQPLDFHAAVSHHEAEDKLSAIHLSANHHHQDQHRQRDLQVPCPLGEAWDTHLSKCAANSCDSQNACKYGETCTYVRRYCKGDILCPQFRCDSPCPEYEQKDAITGQCFPVSCQSPRACSDAPANKKVCMAKFDPNCNPIRGACPVSGIICCEDISKCDSLYCAYGKLTGPDGCLICDCKDCWGYVGGDSGRGMRPSRKYFF